MPTSTTTAAAVATHSDGNSDEILGAVVDSIGKQARKDRKRATDRVAQREHRRRQKLYVEDLEAQIKILKQQSVRDDRGATLLEENEKLRKELKDLKTLLSAIQGLINSHTEPANIVVTPESNSGQIERTDIGPEAQDAIVVAIPNGASAQLSHADELMEIASNDATHYIQTQMPVAEGQIQEEIFNPNVSDIGLQPREAGQSTSQSLRDWWAFSSLDGSSLRMDHSNHTGTDTPMWLNNFFTISSLSPSGQLHDLSNPIPHAFDSEDRIMDSDLLMTTTNVDFNLGDSRSTQLTHQRNSQNLSSSSIHVNQIGSDDKNSVAGSPDSTRTKFQVQIHRSLSHVLMPPLPEDVYVHEIIERARSNALSRRMLLDAPTLADFLVDNSTNVLSSDLKKYLEPVRRSKRTIEYLGTYWVSYLLLRWQVNQSEESYARIPPWFRPTELQMHVPHPIAVDFVAWPRMRDELLRVSQTEPDRIHQIMYDIGVYLDLNVESGTLSLTNEEALNAAVCDLNNWKLKEGFFEKYPELQGMCEPVSGVED